MDRVLKWELNGGLLEVSISFASLKPAEVRYLFNLLVTEDMFVIWESLIRHILGQTDLHVILSNMSFRVPQVFSILFLCF